MKKLIKVILIVVGILFLLVGFVMYKWKTNTSPCLPDIPERVGQVPKTARWIGGCDGGHWFDIIEVLPGRNRYRIAIYFDYNGELYTDEYFEVGKKCSMRCDAKYNDAFKILDDILFYSGYTIELRSTCYLVPLKKIDKFEEELQSECK